MDYWILLKLIEHTKIAINMKMEQWSVVSVKHLEKNGINVAAQSWELQQIKCDNLLSIHTMDFLFNIMKTLLNT